MLNGNGFILPQQRNCRKAISRELFYLAYTDDAGNFRFESAYNPQDLEQGNRLHQLITPNTFYRKPKSLNTLHTLYALWIDLDGFREPFPISQIDILERWHEIGFSKPPSRIIYTSLGHYHLILSIEPVRAFPEKVSFWKACAKSLATLFRDLGADIGASINPIGFIRTPGHINTKYHYKPLVETVLQSESIFTLSEIYEVLKENGCVGINRETPNIEQRIRALWENGVPYGKRDRAALTLSIYCNKHLGLSPDQCLEKLHDWNSRLIEPLKPWEIKKAVRSAYHNDYGLSQKWLNYLIQDEPGEIKQSYERANNRKKTPLRTTLKNHAEKIKGFILSQGGFVEISQRKLARELNIPWRSYIEAVKKIPELQIEAIGKGRNAKSILRIWQEPKLKLVQINGALNGA